MKGSFEQHLSDKLKSAEWQASDQVLNNILDRRKSKSKPWLLWVIGFAIISTTIVLIVPSSKPQPSQALVEQSSSSPSVDVNTLDRNQSDVVLNPKSTKDYEAINANKAKKEDAAKTHLSDVKKAKAPIGKKQIYRPIDQVKTDNLMTDAEMSLLREVQTNKPSPINVEKPNRPANSKAKHINNQKPAVIAQDDQKWRVKANMIKVLTTENGGQLPEFVAQSSKGQSRLVVYNNPKLLNEHFELERDFLYSRAALIKKVKVIKQFEDLNHVNAQKEYALNGKRPTEAIIPKAVYFDLMLMPGIGYAAINGNADLAAYNPEIMHVQSGYAFGARLSIPMRNAMSMTLGIQSKQQSNLYKGGIHYKTNEQEITSTTYYINDPVQGVIPVVVYDTTKFIKDNVFGLNHKNRYQMTQVPIGLAYQFGVGKTQFAFHTAAVLNWVSSANGKQIDVQQQSVTAFNYKGKSFSVGGNMSLLAAYPLSPRFKLFVEPGVQWFKIKAMNMGNNFNEAVINYNASFGLRYTVF